MGVLAASEGISLPCVNITETFKGNADNVIRAAKLILSFCALSLIIATIYFESEHLFAIPIYDDMFDRLRMYRAIPDPNKFIEYLFSPHNEHRITTTRLLALLDELQFGGREYVQIFSANIFQCISLLLTVTAFNRGQGHTSTIGGYLFLCSSLLLLFVNPDFLYTLLVPFQVQHAIMELLCVAAALVISGAAEKDGGPTPRDKGFFASLLALALVASFTLGNGPVILLSAAACALVLRWRMTTTLVLIALAVAHVAIVLFTTNSVGEKSHDIMQMLRFAVIYWGSPFMRFEAWPGGYVTYGSSPAFAMAAGVVVLATGVFVAIARIFKPGLGGSLAVFGLVLLMIVIATGLAAALSRAQFGVLEAGNKKYASFAALGWVGSLAIYVALLRAWFASRTLVAEIVALVPLLFLLPLSAIGFERETRLWAKETNRVQEAATAVLLGVNTPALKDIYQPPDDIADYVKFTEPLNRGVFAQFTYRWGEDAGPALARMHATTCRGSAQDLTPVPPEERGGVFHTPGTPAKISGWTWMDSDHAPAPTVIAVDPKNRIVGLARTTRPGEIAEEWLSQKLGRDVGWFGFARVEETPLRFYAISRNGRHYCALGGIGDVR